eukprot:TRINITY_DN3768_c0_g1_i2.p1 TRINITY_DN3768_c0_g1~~TRINITY_DN3768_c0_g1_i2.p1  ORF type:complete len:436 (+),score=70.42 TRINITY_DN3768_c0_g1_i2:52-1359(+)
MGDRMISLPNSLKRGDLFEGLFTYQIAAHGKPLDSFEREQQGIKESREKRRTEKLPRSTNKEVKRGKLVRNLLGNDNHDNDSSSSESSEVDPSIIALSKMSSQSNAQKSVAKPSLLPGFDYTDSSEDETLSNKGQSHKQDFFKELDELAQKAGASSDGKQIGVQSTTSLIGAHPHVSGIKASKQKALPTPSIPLPEEAIDEWDNKRHRFHHRGSSLGTFRCWKCNQVGHLADDCVASINIAAPLPSNPSVLFTPRSNEEEADQFTHKHCVYSSRLRTLYKKCKEIQANAKSQKCQNCGRQANLAHCLDCGGVFCDVDGHLQTHLRSNPSHTNIYSYKLQRQVKCCKPTCEVTSVRDLMTCSHCLGRIFDRRYSMTTATWSRAGLKAISNSIACDDHFEWHRLNCPNATQSAKTRFVCDSSLDFGTAKGELSEFFF